MTVMFLDPSKADMYRPLSEEYVAFAGTVFHPPSAASMLSNVSIIGIFILPQVPMLERFVAAGLSKEAVKRALTNDTLFAES